MSEKDLVLNSGRTPSFEEIGNHITGSAQTLWQEFNESIQEYFGAKPKLTYSKCLAQPGWNIKYKKNGRSICTLYPERDGFIALVVIPLSAVPFLEAGRYSKEVLDIVHSAEPYNGTLWLMVPVRSQPVQEDVLQLAMLKYGLSEVDSMQ